MLLSGKGTRPVGQLRPPPLTAYNQVPSCYDGLPDGPDLSRACERVLSTLVLEWQCSAIPYLSVLERIEDVMNFPSPFHQRIRAYGSLGGATAYRCVLELFYLSINRSGLRQWPAFALDSVENTKLVPFADFYRLI